MKNVKIKKKTFGIQMGKGSKLVLKSNYGSLIRIAQLSEHDTILDKHVCRVEKKKIPTI
jgi:hypothetical protein